jgi:hypothetical protein
LSGDIGKDSHAQLAVMDAIVWTVVVASALGGLSNGDIGPGNHLPGRAAEMLRVFLDASVGRQTVVLADGCEIVVPAASRISVCIAVELAALDEGTDPFAFRDLNDALCDALDSIAGPSVSAYLCVYDMTSILSVPVLALPRAPPDSPNLHASSCVLDDEAEEAYLAVLLLDPSVLVEEVMVA